MSANKKPTAKAVQENDDLLGEDTSTQDKAAADKAAADKAAADKAAADKAAKAKKTAEQKKIEAAQGDADNDFIPKESDKHLYHVKMEKRAFNPQTGEKLSKDYVQIYSVKEWNAFKKDGQGLGFTTTVLWNPENYK